MPVPHNYGAFVDTQISGSLPLDVDPGPAGMGEVWAPLAGGIKYRFIQEDSSGWRPQVAVFPQIFIPVGSPAELPRSRPPPLPGSFVVLAIARSR